MYFYIPSNIDNQQILPKINLKKKKIGFIGQQSQFEYFKILTKLISMLSFLIVYEDIRVVSPSFENLPLF